MRWIATKALKCRESADPEGGMDYKQLGMSNQDAEWLASRRFTIEDIARMFNVSPIFLQEYSNSTYSNFSEASRAFSP